MKLKIRSKYFLGAFIFFFFYYSFSQNMYDTSTWTVGSGSLFDFFAFGPNESNIRVMGENHVGEDVVLWQCIPNNLMHHDGGYHARFRPIDNTKTYRVSIWMKKTNSNDGAAYFGVNTWNSSNTTEPLIRLNGTSDTNPFFWSGDLPKLDHWYLLIGYVHPYNYNGLDIGKIYDGETGEFVMDTRYDYKFSSNATQLRPRAFVWNDPNLNDILYLHGQRMEEVNGLEWSLNQLLSINPNSKLIFAWDNAGNQKQRFYCEGVGCPIPSPPAGRITPDDLVVAETVKTEDFIKEEQIISNTDIKLFPNPTKNDVKISLNFTTDIKMVGDMKIYNSNGTLVKSISNKNKTEYNLSLGNLSSGTYFVHFHLNNGNSITKQIIKN